MRMYDLIMKKRNGGVLNEDEIKFMISGYTEGSIPDYQMSAMMMAIYFQGMNEEETLSLEMSRKRKLFFLSFPLHQEGLSHKEKSSS